MENMFSRAAALLLTSTLLLSGCSGSLPTSSQNAASTSSSASTITTVSDVRVYADGYWEGIDLPQLSDPTEDMPILTMHTSMGDIKLVLYPEQAPKAVENFYTHAKDGYYDNLTFHRVIEDFVIQGGDPLGTGVGGESIWGEEFETEDLNGCFSFNGALSMANSGRDTNGSQFYIVQQHDLTTAQYSTDTSGNTVYYSAELLNKMGYPQAAIDHYMEVGGLPSLDMSTTKSGYTTFGQVLEGMDVVNAIAAVETDENDKPVEDVLIEGFTINQKLPEKYITLTSETASEATSSASSDEE